MALVTPAACLTSTTRPSTSHSWHGPWESRLKRVTMVNGLDETRIRKQWEEVDALNERLEGKIGALGQCIQFQSKCNAQERSSYG